MNFIPISWQQLQDDTVALAKKIEGRHFDEIISISRGGMVVARILSDLLSLPVSHIAVMSYDNLQQVKEPVISQISPRKFNGEKILLIDELSDSGKTFQKALEYVKSLPVGEVLSAAPYYKKHTMYIPDFWVKELDGWIIFPYEIRETQSAFLKTFGEEEAKKKMHELGLTDWGM